jgi:hypothetical protein
MEVHGSSVIELNPPEPLRLKKNIPKATENISRKEMDYGLPTTIYLYILIIKKC